MSERSAASKTDVENAVTPLDSKRIQGMLVDARVTPVKQPSHQNASNEPKWLLELSREVAFEDHDIKILGLWRHNAWAQRRVYESAAALC